MLSYIYTKQRRNAPLALAALMMLVSAGPAFANTESNAPALRPIAPEPHPFTADKGSWQIEFSPITLTRDWSKSGGERVRTRAISAPLTLKYGITDNADLQLGMDFVIAQRTRTSAREPAPWDTLIEPALELLAGESPEPGIEDLAEWLGFFASGGRTSERERERGLGQLHLRAKINLFGNDEERPGAVSLMPFLSLPGPNRALSPRRPEFGLMIPMGYDFGNNWDVEWTPHLAAVRDANDARHVAQSGGLFVLTRAIGERTEVFAEFFHSHNFESGARWIGTAGPGINYALNENTLLEIGAFFGISRDADDFTAHFTVVRRF